MDMDKLIELIQNYPTWFKLCVAAWIIFGALLVVGLITLRPTKLGMVSSVKAPPVATEPPEPSRTSGGPNEISLEEYFTRLDELSDRFLQRQEFINSMSGREVSWQGYVNRASERGSLLSLHIITAPGSHRGVLVWLPEKFRTQLFSLRLGDLVRVHGTLELNTPSIPDLRGRELTVVTVTENGR